MNITEAHWAIKANVEYWIRSLSPAHRTMKVPNGSRFVVDKRSQAIRFEDETEQSVTVVISELA